MKKLLLVRHAKSSWNHPELEDHQRPLNQRGNSDAALVASKAPWIPQRVLCSSSKRTCQTASIFIQQMDIDSNNVKHSDKLYLANASGILQTLQAESDSYHSLMLIAHNPGVTQFIHDYTNFSLSSAPTCSMFAISWECDSWGLISTDGLATVEFFYPAMFK